MSVSAVPQEFVAAPNGKSFVSKISKYGWSVIDRPGEFRMVQKADIKIDHSYQRENVSELNIQKIRANWSWAACGCILVAERPDGSLWAFDGQHRVMASLNRADITHLPCLVFQFVGIEGEATSFVVSNKSRKTVNAITKYRAMIVAGDPVAVKVKEVLDSEGLTVCETANRSDQIKCIECCQSLAASSVESFRRAVRACLLVCHGLPIPKQILMGLHWIDARYSLLSVPRFVARLESLDASLLMESIRKFKDAQGKAGAKVSGEAILSCVNRGLRKKFGSEGGDK